MLFVITDMNMLGMNGIEVLKNLKEYHPDIKIIVVSGYDDFNYTKQAIKSSAVDFILKPVDNIELNNVLEKCVRELEEMKTKRDDRTVYTLAKPIDKDIIAITMEEKKVVQRLFSEGNSSGIKNTMNRLYSNIIRLGGDNVLTGEFLLKIFVQLIEEQLVVIEDGSENTMIEIDKHIKGKEMSTMVQVKRYVELHYMKHISLDRFSTRFFITKEYLSKAFKIKFQKNLMNCIIELRMEKAKQMLLDKDISIKNVAQTVGYEDVAHFYRVFKNYFGISPGEMRKDN